jgi:hypothetical protein
MVAFAPRIERLCYITKRDCARLAVMLGDRPPRKPVHHDPDLVRLRFLVGPRQTAIAQVHQSLRYSVDLVIALPVGELFALGDQSVAPVLCRRVDQTLAEPPS